MATYTPIQTDTGATFNVGCSGQTAGASTAARSMVEGGSAGSSEVSVDPGNNVTRAVFAFVSGKPGVGTWQAGDYVIPINISTCDGGTQLTRVDVCDFLAGTGYVSVASNTSPGHTRGNTGVLSVTVNRGSDYTPQDATDSQLFVVLTFNNNDAHGASGVGITPSETVTTPIETTPDPVTPATGVARLVVRALGAAATLGAVPTPSVGVARSVVRALGAAVAFGSLAPVAGVARAEVRAIAADVTVAAAEVTPGTGVARSRFRILGAPTTVGAFRARHGATTSASGTGTSASASDPGQTDGKLLVAVVRHVTGSSPSASGWTYRGQVTGWFGTFAVSILTRTGDGSATDYAAITVPSGDWNLALVRVENGDLNNPIASIDSGGFGNVNEPVVVPDGTVDFDGSLAIVGMGSSYYDGASLVSGPDGHTTRATESQDSFLVSTAEVQAGTGGGGTWDFDSMPRVAANLVVINPARSLYVEQEAGNSKGTPGYDLAVTIAAPKPGNALVGFGGSTGAADAVAVVGGGVTWSLIVDHGALGGSIWLGLNSTGVGTTVTATFNDTGPAGFRIIEVGGLPRTGLPSADVDDSETKSGSSTTPNGTISPSAGKRLLGTTQCNNSQTPNAAPSGWELISSFFYACSAAYLIADADGATDYTPQWTLPSSNTWRTCSVALLPSTAIVVDPEAAGGIARVRLRVLGAAVSVSGTEETPATGIARTRLRALGAPVSVGAVAATVGTARVQIRALGAPIASGAETPASGVARLRLRALPATVSLAGETLTPSAGLARSRWRNLGATYTLGPVPGHAGSGTTLYPDEDVDDDGGIGRKPTDGTPYYPSVADDDDSTYLWHDTGFVGTVVLGFDDPSYTPSRAGWVLRYRGTKVDSTTGDPTAGGGDDAEAWIGLNDPDAGLGGGGLVIDNRAMTSGWQTFEILVPTTYWSALNEQDPARPALYWFGTSGTGTRAAVAEVTLTPPAENVQAPLPARFRVRAIAAAVTISGGAQTPAAGIARSRCRTLGASVTLGAAPAPAVGIARARVRVLAPTITLYPVPGHAGSGTPLRPDADFSFGSELAERPTDSAPYYPAVADDDDATYIEHVSSTTGEAIFLFESPPAGVSKVGWRIRVRIKGTDGSGGPSGDPPGSGIFASLANPTTGAKSLTLALASTDAPSTAWTDVYGDVPLGAWNHGFTLSAPDPENPALGIVLYRSGTDYSAVALLELIPPAANVQAPDPARFRLRAIGAAVTVSGGTQTPAAGTARVRLRALGAATTLAPSAPSAGTARVLVRALGSDATLGAAAPGAGLARVRVRALAADASGAVFPSVGVARLRLRAIGAGTSVGALAPTSGIARVLVRALGAAAPAGALAPDAGVARLQVRALGAPASVGSPSASAGLARLQVRALGGAASLGSVAPDLGIARVQFRALGSTTVPPVLPDSGIARIRLRALGAGVALVAVAPDAGVARARIRALGASASAGALSPSAGVARVLVRVLGAPGAVVEAPGVGVARTRFRAIGASVTAGAAPLSLGIARVRLRALGAALVVGPVPSPGAGTARLLCRALGAPVFVGDLVVPRGCLTVELASTPLSVELSGSVLSVEILPPRLRDVLVLDERRTVEVLPATLSVEVPC